MDKPSSRIDQPIEPLIHCQQTIHQPLTQLPGVSKRAFNFSIRATGSLELLILSHRQRKKNESKTLAGPSGEDL